MNKRENYLKAVRFETPDFIPAIFHINDACWNHYPQNFLFDLIEDHKLLFPDFKRPAENYVPDYAQTAKKNAPFTDDFGCVWETTLDGITGTVTKHPLADWNAFVNYIKPNPEICMGIGPIDWDSVFKKMAELKATGDAAIGGLRHGHTFLQLCDIRGYQNFIYDMCDNETDLQKLISMVEEFNLTIVNKYIDMDVDVMAYPEDLGMQNGPMLSPRQFKDFIKPSYKRLISPARQKGIIVHMHSDGYIHDLINDLIECGVDVINLQDLVNGIDWIAKNFSGKICIDIDIDRQHITPQAGPIQIDELIRQEVEKLGSKAGGLMMIYGLYPGVPLENVKAVMDAMEKYSTYYS